MLIVNFLLLFFFANIRFRYSVVESVLFSRQ